MLINLKVKTLDAQTHDFSIDNEITVREFKDKIAEKTNIAAEQQRIIYCGRVLADEKQIKEYDVDGKVVHVAERPPPSQRGASTSSSNSSDGSARERSQPRIGMRNSPLFRALDGMVVGTMAIPVNANLHNNGQMTGNPFTSASTFCMNRITVARHMLDCANNIAAYLENPERGLNNSTLDILTRGRWTMESTLVEVGISASDLPQNQNIVDMVQGAVNAALRHNGNPNVTVLQLPTVFSASENEMATDDNHSTGNNSEGPITGGDSASADLMLEDVIDSEEEGATNTSNVAQAGSIASNSNSNSSTGTANAPATAEGNNNNSATTGTNTEDAAQRRTSTRVLAEVIQQMRTVQTRLAPFIQQFYELLDNEPTFEENDTAARENAQRLFDRVSEGLHYMSHAQHAISDLMLDVSQAAPRYLTCRPIMVEQSGYISSNNYMTAAAAAAARHYQQHQRHQLPHQQQIPTAQAGATDAATTTAATPTTATTNRDNNPVVTSVAARSSLSSNQPASARSETGGNSNSGDSGVEDPTDEPVRVAPPPPPPQFRPIALAAGNRGATATDNQMARLIQAVVNSAPIETEFHVQFNAPSILSIGVPLTPHVTGGARIINTRTNNATNNSGGGTNNNDNTQQNAITTAGTTGTNTPATNTNTSTTTPISGSTGMQQTRSNTATLPTTSTQTRSTSRPQLQIGNLPGPGWNGRFIPSNMMSSFDRFLPCNSHHIGETDSANNQNNQNGNPATGGANSGPAAAPAGDGVNAGASRARNASATAMPTILVPRNRPQQPLPNNAGSRRLAEIALAQLANSSPLASQIDTNRTNFREQILNFANEYLFEGAPINESTTPLAINRGVNWFRNILLYMSQYEKPECDSVNSVLNVVKLNIATLIESIKEENIHVFETDIIGLCCQFKKQLYSVMHICIGSANIELYWPQLTQLLSDALHLRFHGYANTILGNFINTGRLHFDAEAAQPFIVNREQGDKSPIRMEVNVDNSDAEAQDDDDKEESAAAVELPTVVPGSEPWHRSFPNDWLPVITRDMQMQTESNLRQEPFSDAYISGMSAKRKKLMQNSKPPADVSLLIADSVRRAMQTVGVTASTASNQSQTIDEITNAIASDNVVQTSCIEAVRTNARDRLAKDPNYNPEKFPYTTKFVNK